MDDWNKPGNRGKRLVPGRKFNWAPIFILFVILAVGGATVALITAVVASNNASYSLSSQSYTSSGELNTTPYLHLLSSAGVLAMTLPGDLTPYLGKCYNVRSTTAVAHTITIQVGGFSATWDGTSTIATLGGAIGDGLAYCVIANNRISVVASTNVAFS
jgi:hypothetical protein